MNRKLMSFIVVAFVGLSFLSPAEACFFCRWRHRRTCEPVTCERKCVEVCVVKAHKKCGFCTWKWKKNQNTWEHEKKGCKGDCEGYDCLNLDPNTLSPVPTPSKDGKRLKIPCEYNASKAEFRGSKPRPVDCNGSYCIYKWNGLQWAADPDFSCAQSCACPSPTEFGASSNSGTIEGDSDVWVLSMCE